MYMNPLTSVPISLYSLMKHMGDPYSFTVPMLARYLEQGLKATSRTPNVCSDMAATGMSLGTSFDIANMSTRGA